jgi:hypothetical protein
LILGVAGCRLNDLSPLESCNAEIIIPYSAHTIPPQQQVFNIALVPNALTVVAAALKYVVIKNGMPVQVSEERWMPAAIVEGWM